MIQKTILIVAFATLWFGALAIGVDRSEIKTCRRLEQQAVDYSAHFYLTGYEKEMCDAKGITINAKVQ